MTRTWTVNCYCSLGVTHRNCWANILDFILQVFPTTLPLHAQLVNTAWTPQTNQYLVQTAPSVVPQGHVTYLSATFVLLGGIVPCLTAVSMDTSVQMELIALQEEHYQLFVFPVITAMKPKPKFHAQLAIIVQLDLRHTYAVPLGFTVIQKIVVILLTLIPVPVSRRFVL